MDFYSQAEVIEIFVCLAFLIAPLGTLMTSEPQI